MASHRVTGRGQKSKPPLSPVPCPLFSLLWQLHIQCLYNQQRMQIMCFSSFLALMNKFQQLPQLLSVALLSSSLQRTSCYIVERITQYLSKIPSVNQPTSYLFSSCWCDQHRVNMMELAAFKLNASIKQHFAWLWLGIPRRTIFFKATVNSVMGSSPCN